MISSSSVKPPEEHLKHIEIIFQKLKVAGLKLKKSKCDFFKSEIHYLGRLISDKGIQPLPREAGPPYEPCLILGHQKK